MFETKRLPIGVEFFSEIRKGGYYYVDKTELIAELLKNSGMVNLFTHPRRFGKTLTMTMLKSFFEIGADASLFEGLNISKETELCNEYMGKFPVIFLSLKDVNGLNFEKAYSTMRIILRDLIWSFSYLLESESLTDEEKAFLKRFLINLNADTDVFECLKTLTRLLYKHHKQKVVLLIDEYNVPLDNAFQQGYYEEMFALIRGMFGHALKTNEYLQLAVLTGCPIVSGEGIFAGFDNLKVLPVTDERFTRFDRFFGFTDGEVMDMLEYFGVSEHFDETKEWYGGYRFGGASVYCPLDVINYVDTICEDSHAEPCSFRISTGGNALVKRFVSGADKNTQNEIARLLTGEAIEKAVRLNLTYNDIDDTTENLWSALFTTGYITQVGVVDRGVYKLKIPNREVREIFELQIQEWFKKTFVHDSEPMRELFGAFLEGNTETIQKCLNIIMSRMICILDRIVFSEKEVSLYHGLLYELLRGEQSWLINLYDKPADGFFCMLVRPEDPNMGIVIDVKHTPTKFGLDEACHKALEYIERRDYDEFLRDDGRENILAYGIAFSGKRCKVVGKKLEQCVVK